MEERARRRRRRRRHRGGGGAGEGAARPEPETQTEAKATPPPPDWQWRTFPVFFAFASGALIMGFLIGLTPGLFIIYFSVALFGAAFGLAHIVSRTVAARRRR